MRQVQDAAGIYVHAYRLLTLKSEWLLEINCHFKTTKVVHANPHLISY